MGLGMSLPGGFWPGSPDLSPTAKDAGYSCCLDLHAGNGFEFVRVGDVMKSGDEFWLGGLGPWTALDRSPVAADIGTVIVALHYPVRRPKRPLQWSCRGPGIGHGRDPNDAHCRVCAVFHRYINS